METIADRDSYWMLAEAAIWIRTRDLGQALTVDDPFNALTIVAESKQALEELPRRCRSGQVRAVGRRCTYHDSMVKRSEPVGKPLLWRSRGEGAPSDVVEIISPYEWADLEWESSIDGKVTGELRSRLLRRRAWAAVQFLRSDLMREWPSHASSEARLGLPQAPNPSQSELKLARDETILRVIQDVYDAAEAAGEKPPNIRELPSLVLRKLQQQGYTASKRHIETLGEAPEFKKRRRPPGVTVKSERNASQT
jgi:hypothetical protein